MSTAYLTQLIIVMQFGIKFNTLVFVHLKCFVLHFISIDDKNGPRMQFSLLETAKHITSISALCARSKYVFRVSECIEFTSVR